MGSGDRTGMNREQMAWQYLCSTKRQDTMGFRECFQVADNFLAYCKEHREPKAVECEHEWTWSDFNPVPKCQKCCVFKVRPEPPVESSSGKTQQPERQAREWAIIVDSKGGVQTIQDPAYITDGKMVRVREVIE